MNDEKKNPEAEDFFDLLDQAINPDSEASGEVLEIPETENPEEYEDTPLSI